MDTVQTMLFFLASKSGKAKVVPKVSSGLQEGKVICLKCNEEIKEGESFLAGFRHYQNLTPISEHPYDGRSYHTRCIENKTEEEVEAE